MRTYGKIILAAVALCGALWLGAVEVPPLTGRVVDRAGVFGAGASRVEAAVLALENASGGQMAVLSRVIYSLVGIAGLWCITLLFRQEDAAAA